MTKLVRTTKHTSDNPKLKELVEKFKKAHQKYEDILGRTAYRLAKEAAQIGCMIQDIQTEGGFKSKRQVWVHFETEGDCKIAYRSFYRYIKADEWWKKAEIIHGKDALTQVASLAALKLLASPKVDFDPIDEGWEKKGDKYTLSIQGVPCEILHTEGKMPTLQFNGQVHSCAGSLKEACTIAAETATRMAQSRARAAHEEPVVVRAPEEEGWQKKNDGWHKDGYRIFVQENGVCQIWTDEGLIAKEPDVSDALVFVDQDINEPDFHADDEDEETSPQTDAPEREQKEPTRFAQQPLATIPYLAVLEATNADGSGLNDDTNSQPQGILINTAVPYYRIEKRDDDVEGKPWRLSLGTYATEQEAEAAARKHFLNQREAVDAPAPTATINENQNTCERATNKAETNTLIEDTSRERQEATGPCEKVLDTLDAMNKSLAGVTILGLRLNATQRNALAHILDTTVSSALTLLAALKGNNAMHEHSAQRGAEATTPELKNACCADEADVIKDNKKPPKVEEIWVEGKDVWTTETCQGTLRIVEAVGDKWKLYFVRNGCSDPDGRYTGTYGSLDEAKKAGKEATEGQQRFNDAPSDAERAKTRADAKNGKEKQTNKAKSGKRHKVELAVLSDTDVLADR